MSIARSRMKTRTLSPRRPTEAGAIPREDEVTGKFCGGLLTRRQRWGLSFAGWLAAVTALFLAVLAMGIGLYPFLSPTHRLAARILVVEGWVHPYAIESAVAEARSGGYTLVITTGGPVQGSGGYTNDFNTTASVGASRLRQAGLDPAILRMAPSRTSDRDRTYGAAVALREWLAAHHIRVEALNLLTEDVHARRSRLLFAKAFGPRVGVGIIAVPNPDYDARHWWRYSEGVRDVLSEGIAYLYARLVFHPV